MAATESALLVTVPAAEPLVGEHRARLDPSARRGVPPHVTVLYPFAAPDDIDDGVLDLIATGFGACRRFEFELANVSWFGDGVVYLAPEPAEPFRALTRVAATLFPQFPPYRGAFADLTPHVTIGQDAPVDVLRAAENAVASGLPIRTSATTLTLMVGGTAPESWRVHTEFPLRGREPLPSNERPVDATPVHTHQLPATPQRDRRIPATAWIEAPRSLLELGADIDEPVAGYLRRIGRWLLWRAGPPSRGDARYMALAADDLHATFTFRVFPDGSGEGSGPDGAVHRRFRTWKEALRDAGKGAAQ